MNIVMLPSVSGGIGHISRTATLARALQRLDPSVRIEYLLDTDRLRSFNIDATRKMGFKANLLPARDRESRDPIVRACLGDADIIVEDTARYLVPLRRIVPQAAWVSIPLWPVGDELFMDWPYLAQTDAVIWAYAPFMGRPDELDIVGDKVTQTGPFLDLGDVPEDKAEAKRQLGLDPDASHVVYAPRGFPFGADFGHRVLGGAYGAVERLRVSGAHPNLKLVLLAVSKPDELRGVPGLPADLPPWVVLKGVITPAASLIFTRAASVIVAEGTSTMHEAAGLRTPLVIVPGPIKETWLLGTRFGEQTAAHVRWIEAVTPETLTESFAACLSGSAEQQALTERAHALVTGGGGVEAAARVVLSVAKARS